MQGSKVCHVARVPNLGSGQPNEVAAVVFDEACPSSLAAVYASVDGRNPFAAVRLDLVAQAMGHRRRIASAIVPPGWDGVAIVVTGVCADSWHVDAQGFADAQLSTTLVARACCSAFSVAVPPELQQNPGLPQDVQNSLSNPLMPWIPDRGVYSIRAGVSGAESIAAGTKVLRVWAHASGAGGMILGNLRFSALGIPVPQGGEAEIQPRGNVVGPVSFTFQNTDSYLVELVR